jgi:tRNA (cytidine/uridine-2'-O-)-methyltransferase
MRLALYQPDIPQNTGTILRLCGCLGIEAHIIEPAGFSSTDRAFRRAGMDYLEAVTIIRHASWQDFEAWRRAVACRLILFTTKAARSYLDFSFAGSDVLLFGRETAKLLIPMRAGMRSLNVAMAAAIAAGEALRQTGGMPVPSGNPAGGYNG